VILKDDAGKNQEDGVDSGGQLSYFT